MVLPTNEDTALSLDPGKEALDQPTSRVTVQPSPIFLPHWLQRFSRSAALTCSTVTAEPGRQQQHDSIVRSHQPSGRLFRCRETNPREFNHFFDRRRQEAIRRTY